MMVDFETPFAEIDLDQVFLIAGVSVCLGAGV